MKSRYKFRVLLFPLFGYAGRLRWRWWRRWRLQRSSAAAVAPAARLASRGFPAVEQLRRHVRSASRRERPTAAVPLPTRTTGCARGPTSCTSGTAKSRIAILRYTPPTTTSRCSRPLPPPPSGQPKDKFHFTYDTDVWRALSQGGISAGYGAEFAVLAATPPRRIVVAYTEAGSPAASQLQRGDEILQVDGADAVNGSTQAIVDTLNAGLFPDNSASSHTFMVRSTAGATAP